MASPPKHKPAEGVGRKALRLSQYVTHKAADTLQSLGQRGGRAAAGGCDLIETLATVKNFVRRELPAIAGVPHGSPVRMEMPLEGAKSLVLVVAYGEKRVLLRAYALGQEDRARSHVNASRFLAEYGVAVPAIFYTSLDSEKPGAAILVVEEFIQGVAREADEITDDQVTAVACAIAKLHSIQGPKWGRLGEERADAFFPSFMERVQRDLRVLAERGLLDANERRTWAAWFQKHAHLFPATMSFSLTHNDLHSANGLFGDDGRYTMIDVGRLQWGPAARELVRAHYRLLGGDPRKVGLFNQAYFAAMTTDIAASIRDHLPVYEAFHRLTTCVKLTTKMLKHEELTTSNTRRCTALLDELRQMISRPS